MDQLQISYHYDVVINDKITKTFNVLLEKEIMFTLHGMSNSG